MCPHLDSLVLLALAAYYQLARRLVDLVVAYVALLALGRAAEDSSFRPRRHVLPFLTAPSYAALRVAAGIFS